jgi:uncharacterized protein (TIGR02284 family)
MASNEVISLLNDLVTLNKNRVTGYKEIAHQANEEAIAAHCHAMVGEGERNIKDLAAIIEDAGGIVEDKTTTSGFIYNAWMDIVYSDEKEPEQDVYEYCRRMEQTAVKAYDALLIQINEEKAHLLAAHQQEQIRNSLRKLDELLK